VPRSAALVVLLAAVAAGSVGCGGTAHTTCRITNFRVSVSPQDWSEPTGRHTRTIVLANTSGRACTVEGYPSVTFLDRHGRSLPFAITHEGGVVAGRPPRPVAIPRAGSAFLVVDRYRCDLGETVSARKIVVVLPGSRVGRLARDVQNLGYAVCRGGPADPGNSIAVSAIVARPVDATDANQGSRNASSPSSR
jgi:hypothetical protein